MTPSVPLSVSRRLEQVIAGRTQCPDDRRHAVAWRRGGVRRPFFVYAAIARVNTGIAPVGLPTWRVLHCSAARYRRCGVARPTSFRLSSDLLARLEQEASGTGMTVSALVTELLDEGLRVRRFPGVVFRDGPAGRRAGLVGGPDVWEVVRDVQATPGRGQSKIRRIAAVAGLFESQVRPAVDYDAAFPDEIDTRLAKEERVAAQLRELVTRRERL